MRIGILSDTHDKVKRTLRAVEMLRAEGAEVLIHCGDLTGPEIVCACAGLPAYFVFGNNDEPARLRRAIAGIEDMTCLGWGGTITLDGKRIAVTHGHLMKEMRELEEARPDYLLFGHTHGTDDRREGPTRWINPGAIHRADEHTVAVLDLESDRLRFVTIPRKDAE